MPAPLRSFDLKSQQTAWEHTRGRGLRLGQDIQYSPRRASIVIADDQPILRDGMRALLRTESDFRVLGEAADSRTAIHMVMEMRPNILLLDWRMACEDGMQVLRELGASGLPVRTLLTTVFLDNADVLRALQLGAWGVILRDSTTRMLFDAIRKVMAGQYWIGRESVASLVEALRDFSNPSSGHAASGDFGLTRREMQIVGAVVAGYSNSEIAETMSLSGHTVKHHITHIFDKLGVSNRLELALFAVNHRLASEPR